MTAKTEIPYRVAGEVEGVAVHAYGDILINELCPDFDRDLIVQTEPEAKKEVAESEWKDGSQDEEDLAFRGGAKPRRKIKPKKSWEITGNFVGMVPQRTPCSHAKDFRAFMPIHLIDGNTESLWCSRIQAQADVEPAWIRLDLPRQTTISEVVLIPRKDAQGIPAELSIRVSRNAWHWTTVYENRCQPAAEGDEPLRFSFEPTPAKQVWIVAPRCRNLRVKYCGYDGGGGYVFSIAGVQVLDEEGNDVALASRGTCVTVSSTNYGTAGRNQLNKMVWPTLFDLGVKWVRLMGADYIDAFEPLQWHMVERRKGDYAIDPVADEAVTELGQKGCRVILVFFTGNWLYTPKPRENPPHGSWWLYDLSPPPLPLNEEAREPFMKFIRFMVHHFKGRVQYYEIGNEPFAPAYWNMMGEPSAKRFCEMVREAAAVIKQEDPEAQVVLGSGHLPVLQAAWTRWLKDCIDEGICASVDVLAWHPFYETPLDDPIYLNYPQIVRDFQVYAEERGFTGEYLVTESNWSASYPYPNDPRKAFTEIEKAKNAARAFLMHSGLSIPYFWCPNFMEPFNCNSANCDAGLFRNTFSCDPQSPATPQPTYYVLRNICTVMDSAVPVELEVDFETPRATIQGSPIQSFENYNFRLPGGDLLVAVYLPGRSVDRHPGVPADVIVRNVAADTVSGIDMLNGFEQELEWGQRGRDMVVPRLLIRDYPLILRLALQQPSL